MAHPDDIFFYHCNYRSPWLSVTLSIAIAPVVVLSTSCLGPIANIQECKGIFNICIVCLGSPFLIMGLHFDLLLGTKYDLPV